MIIGISGKKYAGKTSAAVVLRDHLQSTGQYATLLSLGKFVKLLREGEGLFAEKNGERVPVTPEEVEQFPALKEQIRKDWQELGTDCVRAIDKNLWVEMSVLAIRAYFYWRPVQQANVLLHDVRFPNEIFGFDEEFDPLKNLYIRLLRDVSSTGDILAEHRSETALDQFGDSFHYVLDNSLMSLQDKNQSIVDIYRFHTGDLSQFELEHAISQRNGEVAIAADTKSALASAA